MLKVRNRIGSKAGGQKSWQTHRPKPMYRVRELLHYSSCARLRALLGFLALGVFVPPDMGSYAGYGKTTTLFATTFSPLPWTISAVQGMPLSNN